ncbi:MAG: sugar-binding domain-containing protein [Lachnospiraceae bacterium]|jgi:beta-galactosidase
MRSINLDSSWQFGYGTLHSYQTMRGSRPAKTVNLPHDYMIESDVYPEAPSGRSSGYYNAGCAYYTKKVFIPGEWEDGKVFLKFEGVMMNAVVEINGSRAAQHHYGYTPFTVDLTPFAAFGEENTVTVMVNPSMQPNSRWYSGAGIFRSVSLIHTPALHLADDGIYVRTGHIEYGEGGRPDYAVVKIDVDVDNETERTRLADVTAQTAGISRKLRVEVPKNSRATARLAMTVPSPKLWSAETPDLYEMKVTVKDAGVFTTHLVPAGEDAMEDADSVPFGIREITADVTHGLRINGKTVKLKGGCLHHDNGILGAVSLYDAEYRKLSKLKQSGYNAVRTTHNPPSTEFLDACDRLGLYVMDEAFDAWGMNKQPGDYGVFFDSDWESDLTAFVRRDRSRACVILWSTGNEIMEHGGLGGGYTLAARLAEKVRSLDSTRPVTNAICSYWSGLDFARMEEMKKQAEKEMKNGLQNFDLNNDSSWEDYSESFTNGLDIVGYNYMEARYERDHERYPDRVILGSENLPAAIGKHWPMIERLPYVLGDFTWTAFDYLGEAGIGQSRFVTPGEDEQKGADELFNNNYPWRTANDADFDICGRLLPQGVYRRIVWGSSETGLFAYDPDVTGKHERFTAWGFTAARPSWTWRGKEGRQIRIAVFSSAEEVEVFVNGRSVGVKKQGEALAADMPDTFTFDTVYEPGTVRAVSRTGGKEISSAELKTAGKTAEIRLIPERTGAPADGHSLIYVRVEAGDDAGILVPDAAMRLTASLEASEGTASLCAFGSGNPVTEDNYTAGMASAFEGCALAVVRAGEQKGSAVLTVSSEDGLKASVTLKIG